MGTTPTGGACVAGIGGAGGFTAGNVGGWNAPLLVEVFATAFGADGFFVAAEKQFELSFALGTDILIDWHAAVPIAESQLFLDKVGVFPFVKMGVLPTEFR